LSGFPFVRKVRDRFSEVVIQTGFRDRSEVPRLLCMHQTVQGAQVGANNYTFRSGHDVVRGRDIPAGFSTVLSGHIHRAQTLTYDLGGRPLASPVVYPGAIERTSFAERTEDKGYVILTIGPGEGGQGALLDVSFVPLPARPMVSLMLKAVDTDFAALSAQLGGMLRDLNPHSVVRVLIQGPKAEDARQVLSAALLRDLAPPTMNINLAAKRSARDRHDSRGD
jgi:DNA repair exonuclease SbcCD nuclease subunit